MTSFSGLRRCLNTEYWQTDRESQTVRQLLEISANFREVGFMNSKGSSVAMMSCSMWSLIVTWSLLCLCTYTEASYYKKVSINPQ